MSANTSSKADVRTRIRHLLEKLTSFEIESASRDIRNQLVFPPGSTVAIFAGLSNEPQLLELISENPLVNWHLPKVDGPGRMNFIQVEDSRELSVGAFGILEPGDGPKASSLDFVVCPGVAFTQKGHRLGQGGGFYDRIIPKFPMARTVGVGFQCQLLAQIPFDQHDCVMDQIILSRTDR